MDKSTLYDEIALRKSKPKDYEPYDGNNGRVNKCAKLIRSGRLASGGVLLDVGGGIGDLGFSVRDLYERTLVLDIAHQNLYAARAKGNEVLCADVDKDGLKGVGNEECTLVTALDFIEHIIDPENFARECYRVLKPNGHVFLNTPNIRFFEHIATLLYAGRFPHTSGDKEVYHGGHLAFFTYLDLQEIFGKAGFTDFEMVMDEEGYRPTSDLWIDLVKPKNQQQFKQLCMEFGCPNLLFKAVKK